MLLLALALLSADPTPTTPSTPSTPAPPAATGGQLMREARLQTAVMTLKKSVKAGLDAELAKGGPVGAIDACGALAAAAAKDAAKDGVRVGRTSTKLRNPQNAPLPWVAPLLAAAELAAARGESIEAQVVPLQDGRLGYVSPITLQPVCLTCHGATLAPPIAEALKAKYPSDQATGYGDGAFRGFFWAELSAPPLKLPAPTKAP